MNLEHFAQMTYNKLVHREESGNHLHLNTTDLNGLIDKVEGSLRLLSNDAEKELFIYHLSEILRQDKIVEIARQRQKYGMVLMNNADTFIRLANYFHLLLNPELVEGEQEQPKKKTLPIKGFTWLCSRNELAQFYDDLLGKFIVEQTEFKDFEAVFCYRESKILSTDFQPIRWHNTTAKEVKYLLITMGKEKLIEFRTDYEQINACFIGADGNTLNISKTTDARKGRPPKSKNHPINKLKKIIEKYSGQ